MKSGGGSVQVHFVLFVSALMQILINILGFIRRGWIVLTFSCISHSSIWQLNRWFQSLILLMSSVHFFIRTIDSIYEQLTSFIPGSWLHLHYSGRRTRTNCDGESRITGLIFDLFLFMIFYLSGVASGNGCNGTDSAYRILQSKDTVGISISSMDNYRSRERNSDISTMDSSVDR